MGYVIRTPKEIKAKVLACHNNIKPKSIAIMLNLNYHAVCNILRNSSSQKVELNPQRKYPYKKK